jgi:hypothetical protein
LYTTTCRLLKHNPALLDHCTFSTHLLAILLAVLLIQVFVDPAGDVGIRFQGRGCSSPSSARPNSVSSSPTLLSRKGRESVLRRLIGSSALYHRNTSVVTALQLRRSSVCSAKASAIAAPKTSKPSLGVRRPLFHHAHNVNREFRLAEPNRVCVWCGEYFLLKPYYRKKLYLMMH